MEKQEDPKQRQKLINRLKSKYRLVIMNDETFEEKASLTLSPMNVIIVFGSFTLFLIISMVYIIAFTPLREYIPGYADVGMRRTVFSTSIKVDSLEKEMRTKDAYIKNLNYIISGQIPPQGNLSKPDSSKKYNTISFKKSTDDSLLRKQVAEEERVSGGKVMASNQTNKPSGSIAGVFFFSPIKGVVTTKFNTIENHYGVDIVAPKDESIKSTLGGKVVFSGWTTETGYVIAIQHENNLLSVYKHNSTLLKKTGNTVKAGEPIAIIGNSGELTTGPHLHFELWYNGLPLNPSEYMNF
jgi:murein DD-endopeptidase MepM/ murein hydrolase activator NlpD